MPVLVDILLESSVADALSELTCALGQVLPSDDHIIVGHMRSAANILRDLKLRMDWRQQNVVE